MTAAEHGSTRLRALADEVLAEQRPPVDRERVAERLYDRATADAGVVAWPGWETLSEPLRESWRRLAREARYGPTAAELRQRRHDDLLAEAVRVLTEAARLTRPVLERDEEASAAAGHAVWVETDRTEPADWAEFVTLALAGAAANIGGIETILAGRPGSWEADGVRQLLTSTVGHDQQYLLEHRTEPVVVDLYVDEILVDVGGWKPYDEASSEINRRWEAAGLPRVGVVEPAGPETEEQERLADELADLEDRLEQQREADWAAYGAALKAAVEAAVARRDGLRVPVVTNVDLETFRRGEDRLDDAPWGLAAQLVDEAVAATPVPPRDGPPPLERLQAALAAHGD